MAYATALLMAAHEASSNHADALGRSEICACFYCLRTFPPGEIVRWIDERGGGQSAMCPRCGIDSVLGSASGLPLTPGFLAAMHERWFSVAG